MSDFLSLIPPDEPLPCGRYGAVPQNPGVRAARVQPALASLCAGTGQCAALIAAVGGALSLTLPQGPGFVTNGTVGFVGTGPGRWIVTDEAGDGEALETRLAAAAGASGAVCDQSDGSVVYEVDGPASRAALAKLLDIDVDPAAFSVGSAATTRAALIGVTLWQVGAAPVYRFAVARSYAPAFLRALASAAAEYGFELA